MIPPPRQKQAKTKRRAGARGHIDLDSAQLVQPSRRRRIGDIAGRDSEGPILRNRIRKSDRRVGRQVFAVGEHSSALVALPRRAVREIRMLHGEFDGWVD